MVIAFRTDLEVLLHLLGVDDFAAVVAFDPESFRNSELFVLRQLGGLVLLKPGHRSSPERFVVLNSRKFHECC